MQIKALRTRIFKEKENLFSFVTHYIKKVPERSVIVITSKIIALSEGRTVSQTDRKTKDRLIVAESDWAMETKYTWITIKDNMVMAAAGIDESNADGKLILLPKDSFKSAEKLRTEFKKHYKIKNLGVLITDSRIFPLRAGVVGVALGYAGFAGIKDYKNTSDIFGRKFQYSQTDIADSLATAAVLEMGEGKEQQPLALITNIPIAFTEKINRRELIIDPREDLYQPLFENIKKIKFKKK